MKLDDISIGEEYAVRPKYGDPRRVKILGIEVSLEKIWDLTRETWKERNVRKVKIKYLDNPARKGYTFPAKNTTILVDAREISALWLEVGPGVRKRQEEAARRDAESAALTKRLKALLGRNVNGYITISDRNASLSLYGKHVDKLLTLAEKGKAA